MNPINIFREKLADEILFILANNHYLSADKLYEEFERRVGANLEPYFVESSLVLSTLRVEKSQPDLHDEIVYTGNFQHELFQCSCRYDNKYREMLLIQVWELVNDGVNQCCWSTDNSALHYLAAIPGTTTPKLVQLLLKAGANSLQKNENGRNILHVIAGRMRAEKNCEGDLVILNETSDQRQRQRQRELNAKDRIAILNVLQEELSTNELTVLAKEQDENGNTAMHEWAFAASMAVNQSYVQGQRDNSSLKKETEIASLLLDFGGLLRLPNNIGHIPLHYAFNVDVFDFLVQQDDLCHVRNDLDETPFMFMIKTIIRQVFSKTCIAAHPELTTVCLEMENEKSVSVDKLTQVFEIVEAIQEVKDTVWIPDVYGNSVFDIVLKAIKIISWYNFHDLQINKLDFLEKLRKIRSIAALRDDLILLLEKMSVDATADELMRPNNLNPLHTLLAMQPHVLFLKCHNPMILAESLDILIQQGVDVNAVDKDGLTPLDIAHKHFSGQPSLYKVIDKLLQHGAHRSNSQSSKREMKSSCPKRHLIDAKKLAKAKSTEENVTVVGKYRYFNDQPIGSGAFSSVFLAIKDEHFNERSDTFYCSAFALKRIEKAKVNPKEISTEVKTLISFSNECEQIVKYYGVEDSNDAFFQYLCLELMDGDLEHAVTNSSELRTGDSQMKAVRDIVKGVAYLHECNFIHRDLKPGNILYTTEPNLHFKISDFGLTKNINSFSMMTSTIGSGVAMVPGTRCWMAPELVSMKSREHTKESDLFSLGLVLHYLLTLGEHPFSSRSGEPPYAIEKRIADMQINIDRELHPEASNFLQCLMAKDPLKRLPTKYINQHPFLWSEQKKIEFLKAVGDQPEAVKPGNHSSSALEQRLQKTTVGRMVKHSPWDQSIGVKKLFTEMVKAWKQKRYRTDKVIDFIRFIRNAYAHMQERSPELQDVLDSNIFLGIYPTLVLDVFLVVQDVGFLESRRNIRQVLSTNVDNRT